MALRAKLAHGWRFTRAVASVTYKEWAAYRTHSMVSIFVGPVQYLVQIFIWRAVYASTGTIGGMSLQQMLAYSGIAAVIGYLTMDFADWNLQMLIRTGRYLTFALRPLHHRRFALAQKLGHRTLGLVFEFIPVFLIFTLVFRVNLVPARPLWAVLSIALSFLMVFYVDYCIGLTGFWLTNTQGLRSVLGMAITVFSGAFIPLTLFPQWVQRAIFWLPFQFITYVPARVYTGQYQLAGIALPLPAIVGLQAAYVLAMLLLSELLYRLGNRRFTGVGA